MSFQRRIEDFTCDHCGHRVSGDGFTNHCPNCLWSKHVDIEPGDRAETCGGLFEPIGLEGTPKQYRIEHRCTQCALRRFVKASANDSVDALIVLSKKGKGLPA